MKIKHVNIHQRNHSARRALLHFLQWIDFASKELRLYFAVAVKLKRVGAVRKDGRRSLGRPYSHSVIVVNNHALQVKRRGPLWMEGKDAFKGGSDFFVTYVKQVRRSFLDRHAPMDSLCVTATLSMQNFC